MSHIRIERLEDINECDDCGTSYAYGYRVYQDGKVIVNLEPVAACFDGTRYDEEDCQKAILEALGHTVEITEIT